jgi:hypothetical protein
MNYYLPRSIAPIVQYQPGLQAGARGKCPSQVWVKSFFIPFFFILLRVLPICIFIGPPYSPVEDLDIFLRVQIASPIHAAVLLSAIHSVLPPTLRAANVSQEEEEANRYRSYPMGHRPQSLACGARRGKTRGREVEEGQESTERGIRSPSSLSHETRAERDGLPGMGTSSSLSASEAAAAPAEGRRWDGTCRQGLGTNMGRGMETSSSLLTRSKAPNRTILTFQQRVVAFHIHDETNVASHRTWNHMLT